MNAGFLAPLVSLAAGAVLASVSVFGLISSQTGPPSKSPANAEAPDFSYGTTTE